MTDGRNYFEVTAVRAKTLVKGDVLVDSGLVVQNVYAGTGHDIGQLMYGSAMMVPTISPTGAVQSEGLSDPSHIGMKMAAGYVLVKASPTGKDDAQENMFFLVPAVRVLRVWQFAENN